MQRSSIQRDGSMKMMFFSKEVLLSSQHFRPAQEFAWGKSLHTDK